MHSVSLREGQVEEMSKPTVSLPVKCARLEPAGALTRLLDLAGPLAAVAQLAQPTRHSVQRLLAAQLLLGRSFSAIARDLTRLLYFAVGWLAAPSRTLRVYGAVRRWHVALGKARPFATFSSTILHVRCVTGIPARGLLSAPGGSSGPGNCYGRVASGAEAVVTRWRANFRLVHDAFQL